MISAIEKLNAGTIEATMMFGNQFNSLQEVDNQMVVVLAEIKVESSQFKIGDTLKLDYVVEFDEFRPLSKNVCLSLSFQSQAASGLYYWIHRPVTMEDMIKMLETKAEIEKLNSGVQK